MACVAQLSSQIKMTYGVKEQLGQAEKELVQKMNGPNGYR